MYILLSHISAYGYWRSAGDGEAAGDSRARRNAARRAQNQLDSSKKMCDNRSYPYPLPCPRGCEAPLHILVSDAGARVRSRHLRSHTWSVRLLDSSFVDLGDGYMMSSPEFSFLQMADDLSLVELIRYGYELCGTYAISEEDGHLIKRKKPLTTVAKLAAFVERSASVRGRKRAERALKYVIPDAASPMETAVSMLLTLPYSLGGYKLDMPLLNQRIDIAHRKGTSFRKHYYVCDLYWSDVQIAVEYDSDLYHTGSERISSDSSRRNELLANGVAVVTMTRKQLRDNREFRNIALQLAQELGKRIRFKEPAFSKAHFELRSVLLG